MGYKLLQLCYSNNGAGSMLAAVLIIFTKVFKSRKELGADKAALQEAKKMLDDILTRYPNSCSLLAVKSQVDRCCGTFGLDAMKKCQQLALPLQKTFSIPLYRVRKEIALLHFISFQFEEALPHLDYLVENTDHVLLGWAYILKGCTLAALGKPDDKYFCEIETVASENQFDKQLVKAAKVFSTYKSTHTPCLEFLYFLSQIQSYQGEEWLSRALTFLPDASSCDNNIDRSVVMLLYGVLQMRSEKFSIAEEILKAVLDIEGRSPHVDGYAHLELGRMFGLKKNYDAAAVSCLSPNRFCFL